MQKNGQGNKGQAGDAGQGEGETSEGGAGGEGEDDGETSGTSSKWVKYDPYFQHNHEAGVGYADMTIDYSDYVPQGGGFSKREMLVVDFQKKQFPVDLTESRQFSALKSSSGFSNQVRKLLQVMSATRYQGGQRRGKLNSRSLWKCKTNDPHIFKQKVENLNLKSTAVSLLVDFSGSMGGDKIDHAVSACLMLNDAIAKLQIPVEIEGFTDDARPVQYIIKKFDERLTEDEIKRRMSMCASYMGSNSDAESLLHSYGRLLQRTEKKKVLIVLSDGQPASSGYGCDVTMLREVVKQIGNGPVKLYGIGIMSDAVENYYPNRTVLKSASDLESCLLDVVKKQIVTGE
jgi:cobalamin biosynthesis protein CobT